MQKLYHTPIHLPTVKLKKSATCSNHKVKNQPQSRTILISSDKQQKKQIKDLIRQYYNGLHTLKKLKKPKAVGIVFDDFQKNRSCEMKISNETKKVYREWEFRKKNKLMKESKKQKTFKIQSFEQTKFYEEMAKLRNSQILKIHGSIVKEKFKTDPGTQPILNQTKKVDNDRIEKIKQKREKRTNLCQYKILKTIEPKQSNGFSPWPSQYDDEP